MTHLKTVSGWVFKENRVVTGAGAKRRECAWADFDNDGWVELFVANEQNQNNFLFHNNSGNGFTRILTGAIATDRGNAFGCCWADYDNDGHLDLFVANGQPNGIG